MHSGCTGGQYHGTPGGLELCFSYVSKAFNSISDKHLLCLLFVLLWFEVCFSFLHITSLSREEGAIPPTEQKSLPGV